MKKTLQVIMLIVILCIFNTAFSYEINAVRIAPWYALNDIAYNAGTYVAVGDKGTILVSSDLTNWQKIDPKTVFFHPIFQQTEKNGNHYKTLTMWFFAL